MSLEEICPYEDENLARSAVFSALSSLQSQLLCEEAEKPPCYVAVYTPKQREDLFSVKFPHGRRSAKCLFSEKVNAHSLNQQKAYERSVSHKVEQVWFGMGDNAPYDLAPEKIAEASAYQRNGIAAGCAGLSQSENRYVACVTVETMILQIEKAHAQASMEGAM